MFSFITKVYKNKKKDYHILLLILIILSSFEFSFLAIYDAFTQYDIPWYARSSLFGIPFLGSITAIILSVFVIKYFIVNKKQEFSILLLSGRKPKDLFVYLMIQFGCLTIISFIIGCFGGTGIMMLINATLTNSDIVLSYELSHVCIYSFIYFIFMILIILAISSYQFVQLDIDLAKYISHKVKIEKPPYQMKMSSIHEKKKIPITGIMISILAIYLMITSMSNLFNPNLEFKDLLMSFTYALAGVILIVNMAIPLIYDLFHNHFLLSHPIFMNGLSSFNEFSRSLMTLINLNACILPIMMFLLILSSHPLIKTMILPGFIMIIMMIGLCFLLKFFIYMQDQKIFLSEFYAIGYNIHQLRSIITIKNFIFICFAIMIPFLFLGELLYKTYQEKLLSLDLIIGIALTYGIVYLGLMVVVWVIETRHLKEVVNHVKYLNRGQ